MSEHKRYFSSKGTPVLPVEASRMIAEQTAAFIKHGGQIQQIPNGVSGQKNVLGPQQVSIGKDAAEPAAATQAAQS